MCHGQKMVHGLLMFMVIHPVVGIPRIRRMMAYVNPYRQICKSNQSFDHFKHVSSVQNPLSSSTS